MERKKGPNEDLLPALQAAYEGTVVPPRINELSHAVIGAAIEVHRHLGPGLAEAAYEEALVIELTGRSVSVERQVPLSVHYKEHIVWTGQMDLLVEGCLIVELKAIESVLPIHRAQLHSYLRAAKFPIGLLLNFNVSALREGIHRVILKS